LGSKNENILFIPYPYISYTSEHITIDRDGLEGRLFSGSDFSLQVSASGSLPVESSGAREGMSDLDPALEIGPALVYNVYSSNDLSIKLDVPLRAVLSSDFKGVEYRGLTYELRAELEYNYKDYLFQLHTGGVWADKKYNNYLYGVGINDATNTRNLYEAKAGYNGYKTSMGLSKKFDHVWAGTFVRHYNLSHNAFRDSPLKEKNSAFYGGIFVAYIFDDALSRSIKKWVE
jgi:outer membrane scaffolding protein for murein synthesis (MipA/OmpV family)